MPNIDIDTERVYYNEFAKYYLNEIIQKHKESLPPEKQEFLNSLLNQDLIVLEKSHDKYIENQLKNNEPESIKDLPSAHGGRVFNDNKIHIYLNKYEFYNRDTIESIIIHELYHYLIRPAYSQTYSHFNSFLTEGIVDMYAIKFMQENEIYPEYSSNYANNVIFLKTKFQDMFGDNGIDKILLNSSIDELIIVLKSCGASIEEIDAAVKKETKFDILINNIAKLVPEHEGIFKRKMLKMSSRSKSDQEALQIIFEKVCEIPELQHILPNLEKLISQYNQISKSNILS